MKIPALPGQLPDGVEVTIVPYQASKALLLPLFESVSAGFPSPAEDYIDCALDLNDLVVQHPAATFFVRVKGHSMIDAGIESGDVRIVWELRGIPCLPLELTPPPKKAIGRSRSFGRPVTCQKQLKEALATHAASAARALREQQSVAGRMQIVIETNPFVKPYYGKTITARFETPTASTPEMIKCAHKGLKRIYKEGDCYTRAGVLLTELVPENAVQTSLFSKSHGKQAVLDVVDEINARFGRGKIKWASEGIQQEWAMRQSHLSKRFTTKWAEIPEVKAF